MRLRLLINSFVALATAFDYEIIADDSSISLLDVDTGIGPISTVSSKQALRTDS